MKPGYKLLHTLDSKRQACHLLGPAYGIPQAVVQARNTGKSSNMVILARNVGTACHSRVSEAEAGGSGVGVYPWLQCKFQG